MLDKGPWVLAFDMFEALPRLFRGLQVPTYLYFTSILSINSLHRFFPVCKDPVHYSFSKHTRTAFCINLYTLMTPLPYTLFHHIFPHKCTLSLFIYVCCVVIDSPYLMASSF